MANNIEYSGIKCDTPGCEFRDDTVTFNDYEKWLNKPCPLCGGNLLTDVDYNHAKLMVEMFNVEDLPALDPDVEELINVQMKAMGLTTEMVIESLKNLKEEDIRKLFDDIKTEFGAK